MNAPFVFEILKVPELTVRLPFTTALPDIVKLDVTLRLAELILPLTFAVPFNVIVCELELNKKFALAPRFPLLLN